MPRFTLVVTDNPRFPFAVMDNQQNAQLSLCNCKEVAELLIQALAEKYGQISQDE